MTKLTIQRIAFLMLSFSYSQLHPMNLSNSELLTASTRVSLDELQKALNAGADVAQHGGSALYNVISYGPLKEDASVACAELLIMHGANVNYSVAGFAPLTRAINLGHTKAAKLLLQHKADLNILYFGGLTPLMIAATSLYSNNSSEPIEMMKLLLEHKADINTVNRDGQSAIVYAREWHKTHWTRHWDRRYDHPAVALLKQALEESKQQESQESKTSTKA